MNDNAGQTRQAAVTPFDTAKLDRFMEEAGIDVIVATSKHNTQYLMGGYKFIFFAAMDAIGHSRYLPMVIYEKGAPDHSAYVGTAWRAQSTRTIHSGRPPCIRRHGARRMPPGSPSST